MKTLSACLTACAILAVAAAAPAAAAAEGSAKTSQQERFAACAHESKGLKGEERRKFMSECLKGHAADAQPREARTSARAEGGQHERMRSCNVAAGERQLHGDERRAFMSSCLKG